MKKYLSLVLLCAVVAISACSDSSSPSKDISMIPLKVGNSWEYSYLNKSTNKKSIFKRSITNVTAMNWSDKESGTLNKTLQTFYLQNILDGENLTPTYYAKEGSITFIGESDQKGGVYYLLALDDNGRIAKYPKIYYDMGKRNFAVNYLDYKVITYDDCWFFDYGNEARFYQPGTGLVGFETDAISYGLLDYSLK